MPDAAAARPLPQPSALTAPFWAAAARERLVRQVCDRCGTNVFTPQVACPACWSEALTWTPSAGRGAVYSYTVVHRAPVPGFDPPYVLGVVDLQEGWSMLTNIVDVDRREVTVGMPVEVAWLRASEAITLPVFRPSPVAA